MAVQLLKPRILITTVEFIQDETPTVYTLQLKLPEQMPFYPGQYVMIRYTKDGKKVNKPYSIASSPIEQGHLDICIKKVEGGHCSNYLHCLKPGDQVEIMGPMGFFYLNESSDKPILFIAGGSGIGPIRSMIHYLIATGSTREFLLFFGNKNTEEIIYHEEFLRLAEQNANFKYHPVLSREDWTGKKGHVQDVVKQYVKDFSQYEAYICGLPNLVEENKKLLLEGGVDKHDVHYEAYI